MNRKHQEAGSLQRKWIEDARRLLPADAEVTLQQLPAWLTKRLRSYSRGHRPPLPKLMLLDPFQKDGWIDHWGSSKGGPFKCCREGVNFVSEPYAFRAVHADAVNRFCEVLGGLEWHVSSDTWWYPMHTVRITIHEKTSGP